MKNNLLAAIFLLLFLILAYAILSSMPQQAVQVVKEPRPSCIENETKPCFLGSCNGTTTCFDGEWSPCSWNVTCTPGSRVPCIKSGCAYAMKTCNECGSGYGPCEPI